MEQLRVLLADDHAGFRAMVAAFLSAQRNVAIVGEAGDGDEAVNQAGRLHPDLVLMDIKMPKRNGFDAARSIKGISPSTQVVMLSFNADESYRRMARQHLADGFIDKSSMKQSLINLIASQRALLFGSAMNAQAA